MLDLDHPHTENIFKAAGFIGRVKMGCRKFSIQNFSDRNETFLNMLQECDELKLHVEKHFKHSLQEINEYLKCINLEIERLAAIDRHDIEKGNCNICNHKLSSFHPGIKEAKMVFYCESCSKELYKLLYDLECYTGVIAI